jgi:hypothetical protein
MRCSYRPRHLLLISSAAAVLVLVAQPAAAKPSAVERVRTLIQKGRYGPAAQVWANTLARANSNSAGNLPSPSGDRALYYGMKEASARRVEVRLWRAGEKPRTGIFAAPTRRARWLEYTSGNLAPRDRNAMTTFVEAMVYDRDPRREEHTAGYRARARVTRSRAGKISVRTRGPSGQVWQRDYRFNPFRGSPRAKQMGPARRIK